MTGNSEQISEKLLVYFSNNGFNICFLIRIFHILTFQNCQNFISSAQNSFLRFITLQLSIIVHLLGWFWKVIVHITVCCLLFWVCKSTDHSIAHLQHYRNFSHSWINLSLQSEFFSWGWFRRTLGSFVIWPTVIFVVFLWQRRCPLI